MAFLRTFSGRLARYVANDGTDPFVGANWNDGNAEYAVAVDGVSGRLVVSRAVSGQGHLRLTTVPARAKLWVSMVAQVSASAGNNGHGLAVHCQTGAGDDDQVRMRITVGNSFESVQAQHVDGGTVTSLFLEAANHPTDPTPPLKSTGTDYLTQMFADGTTIEIYDADSDVTSGDLISPSLASGQAGIVVVVSNVEIRPARYFVCTDRIVTVNGVPAGGSAEIRDAADGVLASASESSGVATISMRGVDPHLARKVVRKNSGGTITDTLDHTAAGDENAYVFGGDVYGDFPPSVEPDPGEPEIVLDANTSFQTWHGLVTQAQSANDPSDAPTDIDVYLPHLYLRALSECNLRTVYIPLYSMAAYDEDLWIQGQEQGDPQVYIPHWHTSRLTGDQVTGTETHYFSQQLYAFDTTIVPRAKLYAALGQSFSWGIRITQYWGASNQDHTDKYRIRDFQTRYTNLWVALLQALKAHSTSPEFPTGLVPDWVEVCNEPDTTNADWTAAQVRDRAKALGDALAAAGFGAVKLFLPSVTNAAQADSYWDTAYALTTLRPYIGSIVYHTYTDDELEGEADVLAVGSRQASSGIDSYMGEFTGATIERLWIDLKDGRVSRWSPFTTAFLWDPNTKPNGPEGGVLYGVANQAGGGYNTGDIALGNNPQGYTLITRNLREGMVRKGFTLNNATNNEVDCLPFRAADGKWVVFVRSKAAQDIWITGLPVGTYNVWRLRAERAGSLPNYTTTITEAITQLSDVSVATFGDSVELASAPDDGWFAVVDDSIPALPAITNANRPPAAPVPSAPAHDAAVSGAAVNLSWGAVPDPDGGSVTYRGIYRLKAGPSAGGAGWSELFPAQAGTSFSLDSTALANGDYEWAVICISSAGLESRWGIWTLRTNGDSGYFAFTVQNDTSNTPPPAPVITAPLAAATIDGSTTVSWTQAPDADADPITHFREHRPGSSGPWTRSGAVLSGHTWDVSSLTDGAYQLRIIASDGLAETPSAIVGVTISNSEPAAAPALVLNGHDVSPYFTLGAPGGLEDGPFREWEEAQVYDNFGIRVSGVRVVGLQLLLRGFIKGISATERAAKLRKLKWIIESQQPAELVFGDDPTKRVVALHRGTRVPPRDHGSFVLAFSDRVEIEWKLELPYREDVDETVVVGIDNAPAVELPQGNGPCRPVFEISGPATDPVIEAFDSDGSSIGHFALEVTLSSGQKRIVDMMNRALFDEAGNQLDFGEHQNHADPGDFLEILSEHFVYDDNPATSEWPTVTCSSGTMVARYRKAWL